MRRYCATRSPEQLGHRRELHKTMSGKQAIDLCNLRLSMNLCEVPPQTVHERPGSLPHGGIQVRPCDRR